MSTLLVTGLVLAIEAAPAVHWSVDCDLRDQGRLVLQGTGPLQRLLDTTQADCVVMLQAGQRLLVTLTDGQGNRARTSITGEGSKVRMRQR